MKLGDRLMTSKSERQRTSGPQKRTKSDFMYCRKFTLRAARDLVKEFRVAFIAITCARSKVITTTTARATAVSCQLRRTAVKIFLLNC